MNDHIHAKMSDLTLCERLNIERVNQVTVAGISSYNDIRRIQAVCDAIERPVSWQFTRNGGKATLTLGACP